MGDANPTVEVKSFEAPADELEAALDAYEAADIGAWAESGVVVGDIIVRDDGDDDSAVWLGNVDGDNQMEDWEFSYIDNIRIRIRSAREEAEPESIVRFGPKDTYHAHLPTEAEYRVTKRGNGLVIEFNEDDAESYRIGGLEADEPYDSAVWVRSSDVSYGGE